YNTILAMTIDSPYNLLVTQSFAPEFGYQHTFTLPARPNSKVKQQTSNSAVKSHLLFDEDAIFTELKRKINTNYEIVTITDKDKNKELQDLINEEETPLFIRKIGSGKVIFISLRSRISLDIGDELVVLTPHKD